MISRKKLNEHLENLSKQELIQEVEKLFQKFSLVQQYYTMDLGEDSTALLEAYKQKMEKIFFPLGFGADPKMPEVNRLIKEFFKVSVHIADTIDLMLYKIELSIRLFENGGMNFRLLLILSAQRTIRLLTCYRSLSLRTISKTVVSA